MTKIMGFPDSDNLLPLPLQKKSKAAMKKY